MSFICCLIPMLAIGGAGALAWHKVNSVPTAIRANLTFLEALKFKQPVAHSLTPEQHAKVLAEAIALKDKLVTEFPALKVKPRPVAAEANGFLLLHQLSCSNGFSGPPISDNFKRVLNCEGAQDSEIAKRCLDENAELVSRIEQIAALTTRSSSNMPPEYNGFISARTGKTGCDILLLKARLAAEAGDETETLRLVAAAGNLGSHYHDVECPSLLSETVAILIDLSIQRVAFKTLLPALGRNADLGRWQGVFGKRAYTSTDLAQVMRGEWNVTTEYMVLPITLAERENRGLPDVEAVARTYTAWSNTCVTRLPSLGLADVASSFQPPSDVSHLSKEGREMIDVLCAGPHSWTQGYLKSAAAGAQHHAALDLLVLEKSGVVLAAADAERVTRDSVSGSTFVFDATKRTLAAPSGSAALGVEPLSLPW